MERLFAGISELGIKVSSGVCITRSVHGNFMMHSNMRNDIDMGYCGKHKLFETRKTAERCWQKPRHARKMCPRA